MLVVDEEVIILYENGHGRYSFSSPDYTSVRNLLSMPRGIASIEKGSSL